MDEPRPEVVTDDRPTAPRTAAQELALYDPKTLTFSEIIRLGNTFGATKWFPDVAMGEQAMTKILAGVELGVGPFRAMADIDIVEGKPRIRSRLLASLVRAHPRYDYRVVERTAERCVLRFIMDGEALQPEIEFTIEEAKTAGLVKARSAWETYPSDMLFARAMSRGVSTHCPDVTGGTVYVEGEDAVDERQPYEEWSAEQTEASRRVRDRARAPGRPPGGPRRSQPDADVESTAEEEPSPASRPPGDDPTPPEGDTTQEAPSDERTAPTSSEDDERLWAPDDSIDPADHIRAADDPEIPS